MDAAFLNSLGCFEGIARRRLTWVNGDRVSATGRIDVTIMDQPRAVIKLDGYASQTIKLSSTRPNLGGERWWFVCPVTGRRCRTLYLTPTGDRFMSREAAHLAYRSNRLGFAESFLWCAHQLQDLLPGAQEQDYPPRPKGMHRRTYKRIVNRLREAKERASLVRYASLRATADKLGLLHPPLARQSTGSRGTPRGGTSARPA
jgi:hypothetical protein